MAPVHVRTRITRRVRRTIGFTTTTTMYALVMGLCINRDEWGAAIAHGINTLGTPASMRTGARAAYAHILTGSDAIMGTSSRVVANLWPSDGSTSDQARFAPWAKGASTRGFPHPFAPPRGKGRDRYSMSSEGHVRLRTAGRHINLKRIGVEGQQRIIPHQGGQLGHAPGAKLGESGVKRRWTRLVRRAQLLHVGAHDLLGGGQGRQRRVVPQGIHERLADALLTRSRSVRMPDGWTVQRPGGQDHDQCLDFLGQRRRVPQVGDQGICPVTNLRTMDHHGTGATN